MPDPSQPDLFSHAASDADQTVEARFVDDQYVDDQHVDEPVGPARGPSPFTAGLNPDQLDAVVHAEGPLLVVAGAGSGKTRVLTHRIAHLIDQGVPPSAILAITFTNKAAEEMKERTERLCGLKSAWVSTFHSLAARILRRHIHRIDPYDNSFTIYDADDCRALIREILQDLDIDTRLWPARSVQEKVSHLKNTTTGDIEATFGSGLAVLTNMLPINGIAGFGTQEAGWVAGFAWLGVGRELALATGLGAHLVQLANACLFGLLGHLAMGLASRPAPERR